MRDYFRGDTAVADKVRAMIRRGKSDRYISAYVGMPLSQVEAIGRTISRTECEERWADYGEPLAGVEEHWARENDAIRGSAALLEAMRRVG